jgi:hypothetical protein
MVFDICVYDLYLSYIDISVFSTKESLKNLIQTKWRLCDVKKIVISQIHIYDDSCQKIIDTPISETQQRYVDNVYFLSDKLKDYRSRYSAIVSIDSWNMEEKEDIYENLLINEIPMYVDANNNYMLCRFDTVAPFPELFGRFHIELVFNPKKQIELMKEEIRKIQSDDNSNLFKLLNIDEKVAKTQEKQSDQGCEILQLKDQTKSLMEKCATLDRKMEESMDHIQSFDHIFAEQGCEIIEIKGQIENNVCDQTQLVDRIQFLELRLEDERQNLKKVCYLILLYVLCEAFRKYCWN